MRRNVRGHEAHLVECEAYRRRARHVEMTIVHGVERAAEHAQTHYPTAEVERSATSRHIASTRSLMPAPVAADTG